MRRNWTGPGSRARKNAKEARALLSGTRAQAIQRLQVGLCGIAAMVLLVGLANIIMVRAQQAEVTTVPDAVPTVSEGAKPGGGPLADAGVIPDVPAEAEPTPDPAPEAAVPEAADLPAEER